MYENYNCSMAQEFEMTNMVASNYLGIEMKQLKDGNKSCLRSLIC